MDPLLVLAALALLQTAGATQEPVPAAPAAPEAESWELSGSAYYSHPPDSEARLTTILYGDRGPLHLELRYAYEDLNTVSFFAGRNFEFGDEVEVGATPMLGGVTGNTDGIAPALELDVGWKRLAFYTEAEYLFDLNDGHDDFFYSWSTLLYGVTDWLRAGVVTERSRLVDTGLSLQRGLAVEITRAKLGLSLYAYNLDSDDFYAVVSLGFAP